MYNVDYKSVLSNLKDYVVSHYSFVLKVLGVLTLLFVLYSQGGALYLSCSNSKLPTVSSSTPYRADYSSDKSYLGCVAEQLKCVYANVQSEVGREETIKNCGEEHYCAVTNSTPK